MAEGKRSTGSVSWFSAQKGFGFIAPDDGGEDLFVHQTSIQSDGFRTLSEGQPVEFAIDFGEDGRTKAVDVVGIFRSRRARAALATRVVGEDSMAGGGEEVVVVEAMLVMGEVAGVAGQAGIEVEEEMEQSRFCSHCRSVSSSLVFFFFFFFFFFWGGGGGGGGGGEFGNDGSDLTYVNKLS
ncbi:hypothetical protein GH714_001050 [Hevea brasiliensis]|uniref:CSD domain-containing protein n=1 Tax=Hevea brasiliensis TaxID=3981 RepID=A0A6A6LAM7_HEVBR|nr:hypothetical protein GH714_001050 [Hevea brasiliensis]